MKKKDESAVAVRWEHDEKTDREIGYCEDGSVWGGGDAPVPEAEAEVVAEPEPPAEPEAPAEG